MKTIGILGGFGPDATTRFEECIHEESRRHLPPRFNQGYPPVVSVYLRHPPILIEGDRPVLPLTIDPRVLEASRRLGEWADFLVIVANTPHLFLDEIQQAAGCEVLSMVDVVVAELRARNETRPGLLGLGVTQAYVDRFADEGIEPVLAPESARAALDEGILRTLEGRTTDAHRRAAHAAVTSLRDAGVSTVILGCTEIPILLGEEATARDLVDPGRLLAVAAVRRAIDDGDGA